MNKVFSLILLTIGIVLIVWGVAGSESFGSDVSRFFTGSPTEKTVWLLIGGAILGALGLFGIARRGN